MHVLISIPNTKKSERFPGKNKVLSRYTVDWLKSELKTLPAEWEVEIVEVVSPFTDEICTPYKKFEVVQPDNHQKLTEALQKAFPEHIHVHCQLTQPKRRRGLLVDCVNTLLYTDADVVSTYVSWRNDYNWRELQRVDNKVMFDKSKRSEERVALYDGSLYCAKDLTKIFDTTCMWEWIWNYSGPVVDIDFREDLPNKIEELIN